LKRDKARCPCARSPAPWVGERRISSEDDRRMVSSLRLLSLLAGQQGRGFPGALLARPCSASPAQFRRWRAADPGESSRCMDAGRLPGIGCKQDRRLLTICNYTVSCGACLLFLLCKTIARNFTLVFTAVRVCGCAWGLLPGSVTGHPGLFSSGE
jgi:hypothetical protein